MTSIEYCDICRKIYSQFKRFVADKQISPLEHIGLQNELSRLPIWKTVDLGDYQSFESLVQALKLAHISLDSGYAPELMRTVAFAPVRKRMNFVRMRVSDFGFTSRVALSELYRQAAKCGCFPVPPEATFYVALNYCEQRCGESLFVGMKPLNYIGHRLIFVLFRSAIGQRITVETCLRTFDLDQVFLFERLP